MEERPNYEKDLAVIRNMMERSVKFISLSGMAGVVAGFYAIAASAYIYFQVFEEELPSSSQYFEFDAERIVHLLLVATVTLVASITSGLYFSNRKAKQAGTTIWNDTTKRLIFNLSVPLIAGGSFAVICLVHGYVGMVAPICLLFYGLALVNASGNLFDEMRYLGYCEVGLGIVSAIFIQYGLLFWAIGFGALHIVYGAIMYRKYDA